MRRISVTTFYRLAIWLPLAVPAVLIALITISGGGAAGTGLGLELIGYSFFYGGIPYTALAIWASWWIGGRNEAQIRRLMFRAPLLMLAVFVPLALLIGLLVGAPGPFAAVAALGAVVILFLGYGYVGLTALLRSDFEERVYE